MDTDVRSAFARGSCGSAEAILGQQLRHPNVVATLKWVARKVSGVSRSIIGLLFILCVPARVQIDITSYCWSDVIRALAASKRLCHLLGSIFHLFMKWFDFHATPKLLIHCNLVGFGLLCVSHC